MSNEVDTFLAHYGVKGMRWGVRKNKTSSQSKSAEGEKQKKKLSDKQRKILITAGISLAVGALVVGGIVATKGHINAKELLNSDLAKLAKDSLNANELYIDKFDIQNHTLPRGTSFHRVASKLETEISSPKYASFHPEDIAIYRKSLSGAFKTRFDSLSDVKIASAKEQIKTLSEIMDKPLSSATDKGATVRRLLEADLKDQYSPKAIRKADAEALAKLAFLSRVGGSWQDPASKVLLDELGKKGFSGMVDAMDSADHVKEAVILFNDSIFKTTGSALTDAERNFTLEQIKSLL